MSKIPQVVRSIAEFRSLRTKLLNTSSKPLLGFVPTMGYLHEGHLSLVRAAKRDCGVVAASIFVNPKQFGPKEDLATYPRDLDRDLKLLSTVDADIVFAPTAEEMYPDAFKTYVQVEDTDKLTREGAARPGFFRGVVTVVNKLFNIVQPDKAYFGQKDGIQCIVIKKMVKDLNMPIDVVISDTLRESDGLAMSSRNTYLTPEQRSIAPILYQALQHARKLYETSNERSVGKLLEETKKVIAREEGVRLDYIIVSDMDTGSDMNEGDVIGVNGAMISGAIWNGKTRLIDNILLK